MRSTPPTDWTANCLLRYAVRIPAEHLLFAEGQLVDLQVTDFPLERLTRNAALRRRAARAGDPAARLFERGFDHRLFAVRQRPGCTAGGRATFLREPRLL